MDAKKIISKFIKPNMIASCFLHLIPFYGQIFFFCIPFPAYLRAKKSIAKLEARGELEKAAAELTSANKKCFINGKVVFTDNYVFCRKTGFIFTYDEILWAYKHRQVNSILFIPIKVTDSLYLATKDKKPRPVAAMGKDLTEEVKNSIIEIYNHNNNCLIGYSNETCANYKQLTKN